MPGREVLERNGKQKSFICGCFLLLVQWFDPNSVRQNLVTSGLCTTRWAWDGTTPISANEDGTGGAVGYRRCWSDKETSFDVVVPSFFHPGNFTIEMAHRYRDDEYVMLLGSSHILDSVVVD
jgi:hypothetical protein